jgi:hypothetical protein
MDAEPKRVLETIYPGEEARYFSPMSIGSTRTTPTLNNPTAIFLGVAPQPADRAWVPRPETQSAPAAGLPMRTKPR